MTSFRPERVYLGWQYALRHADPGPPPRRPVPPDPPQLSQGWLEAQRREESMLNRPVWLAAGAGLAVAALAIALGRAGVLSAGLSAVTATACGILAGWCGRALWRAERALRARVACERLRVGQARAAQERRLFSWQEEHARRFRDWQEKRHQFSGQPQWYAVALPAQIDRVDVAGGTLAGWSAMLTMIAVPRLEAGGEVTVIDLSEGAVAQDLLAVAARTGIDPLVWVLPADLPRLDLGAGLPGGMLADVLSVSAAAGEDQGAARDPALSRAIIERIIGVLGPGASIAGVTAGLRALGQVGDPRTDLDAGLLSAAQLEQITGLYGRGAADRVVIERAWALEARLGGMAALGSAPARLPRSRLRVLALDRAAAAPGAEVLGSYLAVALAELLRLAPLGERWQHTLILAGAERLRGDVLDRLSGACEATGTGLALAYRSIPGQVKERLGRGNAAVAFMRLGNAEDAKVASEQIGTEHRFVLTQLTDTVGTSVTDTAGDSYTSTVGTADSLASSASITQTTGHSRGRGRSRSGAGPFVPGTGSGSRDTSRSRAVGDSESLTEGINASTAWGLQTSRAVGANSSLAQTTARSREFLVEPHQLQQLPPSAVIVSYASPGGRRVVLADANPGILALPTATILTVEEASSAPVASAATDASPAGTGGVAPAGAGPARGGRTGTGATGSRPARPAGDLARSGRRPAAPVSWRSGTDSPPPNVGPPPERPDWRTRRG